MSVCLQKIILNVICGLTKYSFFSIWHGVTWDEIYLQQQNTNKQALVLLTRGTRSAIVSASASNCKGSTEENNKQPTVYTTNCVYSTYIPYSAYSTYSVYNSEHLLRWWLPNGEDEDRKTWQNRTSTSLWVEQAAWRLRNSFQLRTSEGHLGFLIQRKVPHSFFHTFYEIIISRQRE